MVAKRVDLALFTVPMRLKYGDPFPLELGAGKHGPIITNRCKIGLNSRSDPGSDLFWDLNYGLPFLDESVSDIHSNQVLEHISEIIELFNDMWRVLVHGGTMHHVVPYFRSPHAFGDPTHVRFFSEESFKYFCMGENGQPFSEQFSDYGIQANFRMLTQVLNGDSLEVHMKKD